MKARPIDLRPPPTAVERSLPTVQRWLLVALVFAAFLTQVKLVPSMDNNVGPFEVIGSLLILAFLTSSRTDRPLSAHPTSRIGVGILLVALASLINIDGDRLATGLVNVAILSFFAAYLVTADNLVRQYSISPGRLLAVVSLALLVVGPWIVASGLAAPGDLQEVGPFRNRAHMASYMLTAFWMVLAFAQWPRLRWRSRAVAWLGVLLCLYAVAISGRRSVYLSLGVGVVVLAVALLGARRGTRVRFGVAALLVVAALAAMYTWGSRYVPQLAFFKTRVGMIDDRLESALGVSSEEAEEESFFALQRDGVRTAFREHPLLGIGWGGFARSRFSPTGHEVHSTPLRFLAETGLLGLLLYVALMISLGWSVGRALVLSRGSPYFNSFLVLAVGYASLLASYLYNRHVTERTFWILTLVIFAGEHFAARVAAATRRPDQPGSADVRHPQAA